MNFNDIVDSTLDAAGSEIPQKQRAMYKEAFEKIFKNGEIPYEALGMGSAFLEHLYAYGHGLYKTGNYKKAAQIFSALSILNPNDSRYVFAQAATHQKMKMYPEAIQAYLAYARRVPEDPEPLYYLYDCFLQTGLMQQALESLIEAITRCGNNKQHAHLKAKCIMIIKSLRRQVQEIEDKIKEKTAKEAASTSTKAA